MKKQESRRNLARSSLCAAVWAQFLAVSVSSGACRETHRTSAPSDAGSEPSDTGQLDTNDAATCVGANQVEGLTRFRELRVDPGAGSNISAIAALVGDVNSDAIADLVMGSSVSNNPENPAVMLVTVRHGDGCGGLGEPTEAFEFDAIRLTALEDINGNGQVELFGATNFVFEAFQERLRRRSEATSLPGFVHWGDVNGDRNMDFVVATEGTLEVGLGRGNGRFEDPISSPYGVVYLEHGTLVDVDGDGAVDLVGVLYLDARFPGSSEPRPHTLEVIFGDGAGGFNRRESTPPPVEVLALVAGDLDGEGTADLVISADTGAFVTLLRSSGGWSVPRTIEIDDTSSIANAVTAAIADVNGDGRADIVAATRRPRGAGTLAVMLGNGDGSFLPPERLEATLTPMVPFVLATGDLNADQMDDIIAMDPAIDQYMTVWMTTGLSSVSE